MHQALVMQAGIPALPILGERAAGIGCDGAVCYELMEGYRGRESKLGTPHPTLATASRTVGGWLVVSKVCLPSLVILMDPT